MSHSHWPIALSGILSYFAVQAGATHVYAVEASNMAPRIKRLLAASPTQNPALSGKITVVGSKIEALKDGALPPVDTIVSEPIGVFLVHERMLESYLYARDHFLRPGGSMVPSTGTVFISPFTDGHLWTQTMAKARFWEQQNFYGVDLSPLYSEARDEVFGQPVVGGFDEKQLLAPSLSHHIDFETVTMEALKEFVIPFSFVASYTGLMHGMASWFDIDLAGHTLSTAPNLERTHWHQVRLLLKGTWFFFLIFFARLDIADVHSQRTSGRECGAVDSRMAPLCRQRDALVHNHLGIGHGHGRPASSSSHVECPSKHSKTVIVPRRRSRPEVGSLRPPRTELPL